MSETVQWIIVGVAIMGAMIAAFRFFSNKRSDGCVGCELKSACKRKMTKIKSKNSTGKNLQNKK